MLGVEGGGYRPGGCVWCVCTAPRPPSPAPPGETGQGRPRIRLPQFAIGTRHEGTNGTDPVRRAPVGTSALRQPLSLSSSSHFVVAPSRVGRNSAITPVRDLDAPICIRLDHARIAGARLTRCCCCVRCVCVCVCVCVRERGGAGPRRQRGERGRRNASPPTPR